MAFSEEGLPGGARYYVDLLRDRLLHALKQAFGNHQAWERVEAAYAAGDYAAAADFVLKELVTDVKVPSPARFQSFARRIPVRVDNSGSPQRESIGKSGKKVSAVRTYSVKL